MATQHFLTPHFSIEEMTTTNTGLVNRVSTDRYGVLISIRLARIAEWLECLRTEIGKPIYITSGYRSLEVNKAVHGVKDSRHLVGLAVDIQSPDLTAPELHLYINTLVFEHCLFYPQLARLSVVYNWHYSIDENTVHIQFDDTLLDF